MAKKTSPVVWIALAATLIAAVYVNRPQDAPKKATTRNNVGTSSKKKSDLYTEEDRKATAASFPPIAAKNRDVFVPIVKRSSGGGGVMAGMGSIPGVAGWVFTGSAEVGGVPQALLENRGTGEGVFLKTGELWNGLTVLAINSDSLSLRAEDGSVERVEIQSDVKGQTPGVTIPPVTISPLSGAIGNQPLTVEPTDGSATTGRPGRNRRRNNAN